MINMGGTIMNKGKAKLLSALLAASLMMPSAATVYGKAKPLVADNSLKLVSSNEATRFQTQEERLRVTQALGNLPEKFDLRDKDVDVVTSVKRQNPFNSCWSFGICAAAESSILTDLGMTNTEYKEKNGEELDLSEKYLAWWAASAVPEGSREFASQIGEGRHWFDEDAPSGDHYDMGGTEILGTELFASGIGPVLEKFYPYNGYDASGNPSMEKEADWSLPDGTFGQANFLLKNGNRLPNPIIKHNDTTGTGELVYDGYDESATAAIKLELFKGRAVALSYMADLSQVGDDNTSDYMNTETFAQYDDTNLSLNHTVCIVGWDDTFSRTKFKEGKQPPEDGAWIIKNSWGPNEYDHGYFYLSYYASLRIGD